MKTKLFLLMCLCFLCIGCDDDYTGHIKTETVAGEVWKVYVKLPHSSEFVLSKKENVHKLILELEELTKQLRDAEERMPNEEGEDD